MELQQLTLPETIDEIQYLISSSNGDTGRLSHILDTIKNKKTLYQSDQNFLENKLGANVSLRAEEKPPENKILSEIQDMIDNVVGDPMRLRHIYDTISKGKQLYHSDQQYLENKLNFDSGEEEKIELFNEDVRPSNVKIESEKTVQEKNIQIKSSTKTPGAMPKGLDSSKENEPSNELTEIKQKIKTEEEKIESEKKLSNEISLHQSKLTELTEKETSMKNKYH